MGLHAAEAATTSPCTLQSGAFARPTLRFIALRARHGEIAIGRCARRMGGCKACRGDRAWHCRTIQKLWHRTAVPGAYSRSEESPDDRAGLVGLRAKNWVK